MPVKKKLSRASVLKEELLKAAHDALHPLHSELVAMAKWGGENRELIVSRLSDLARLDERADEFIRMSKEGMEELAMSAPTPPLVTLAVLTKIEAEMMPMVNVGKRFTQGRQPGTVGPIRRAMEKQLAQNPDASNAEIWHELKSKPPRGCQVFENGWGKYIEGPKGVANMGYARFCNIASEIRNSLRKHPAKSR